MLRLRDQRKYVRKNIPDFDSFAIYYATRGSREELLDDLVEAIFRYTFVEDKPRVRTRAEFEARLAERQHLADVMNRAAGLMKEILPRTLGIEERLAATETDLNKFAHADIKKQLAGLTGPGFTRQVPFKWLKEYPRYLQAVEYRMEKMRGNLARDRQNTEEIGRVWERFQKLPGAEQSGLQLYRWMVEEYRVSLFAQPMGTSMPVSAKRLDKEWKSAVTNARSASH